MQYEGQICRAPMERSSFMLPVMVGCSYNRCKFCNLFRHLRYRQLPMEQIEDELRRVQEIGGSPKKIFLGDGNAFDMKYSRLIEILDLIHTYFPECQSIHMDATVTGILKKTDDELSVLYEKGVRHLYLGIESGLNDVLLFMHKDHDLEQAYKAIERMKHAGLIFDAHIMTGVAGKGRGIENAEALAEFLNRTQPCHVVNFSMFLHKEVPLYAQIEDGSFVPADELENLKEERQLVQMLASDREQTEVGKTISSMRYEGFHDFIQFRVRGTLPEDRKKMLSAIDRAIAQGEGQEKLYSYVEGECPNIERCDTRKWVWESREE